MQASLLPVWVPTPDMNVNRSFTVKMERPKLSKDWCYVPQCKSDGRKRGKYAYMSDVEFFYISWRPFH